MIGGVSFFWKFHPSERQRLGQDQFLSSKLAGFFREEGTGATNQGSCAILRAAAGIRGIPALILFRDGQIIARQAGAMTANQIVAWTTQALAQAPA